MSQTPFFTVVMDDGWERKEGRYDIMIKTEKRRTVSKKEGASSWLLLSRRNDIGMVLVFQRYIAVVHDRVWLDRVLISHLHNSSRSNRQLIRLD